MFVEKAVLPDDLEHLPDIATTIFPTLLANDCTHADRVSETMKAADTAEAHDIAVTQIVR